MLSQDKRPNAWYGNPEAIKNRIVSLIDSHGHMSRADLATNMQMAEQTIKKYVLELKKDGLIKSLETEGGMAIGSYVLASASAILSPQDSRRPKFFKFQPKKDIIPTSNHSGILGANEWPRGQHRRDAWTVALFGHGAA